LASPEFVLFITGQQRGYIEPCGCTGLANQKGGLVRRFTLTRELADRGWPVVPIDVGNQVRRFGPQADIKFQMTIEGLKQMGYQAIGFGPDDLRLSVGGLAALTVGEGDEESPFVCANTAVIDPSLTPRYQIVEVAGRKIGITAVLGAVEQGRITSDEIVKTPADEALRSVWPELSAANCDLYVLLAHTFD
jgi:2',3'-cyclic-nucleotide 2'-phosphodiesterase (5'-nucleotidase family)